MALNGQQTDAHQTGDALRPTIELQRQFVAHCGAGGQLLGLVVDVKLGIVAGARRLPQPVPGAIGEWRYFRRRRHAEQGEAAAQPPVGIDPARVGHAPGLDPLDGLVFDGQGLAFEALPKLRLGKVDFHVIGELANQDLDGLIQPQLQAERGDEQCPGQAQGDERQRQPHLAPGYVAPGQKI